MVKKLPLIGSGALTGHRGYGSISIAFAGHRLRRQFTSFLEYRERRADQKSGCLFVFQ